MTAELADGQLTLTGDAASNQVHLQQNAVGHVVVSGLNGTRINGRSSFLFKESPTLVAVNLGAGNDWIGLRNARDSEFALKGEDGNDTIVVDDGGPASITIDGGAGHDRISLNAVIVQGTATIDGGASNDRIVLNNARGTDFTVDGGMDNDAIAVLNSSAHSLNTKGGDGNDAITMFNTTAFELEADGGAGNDWIALGNIAGTDKLNVMGDAGDDRIVLNNTRATDLTVDGGIDNDAIVMFNTSAFGLKADGEPAMTGLPWATPLARTTSMPWVSTVTIGSSCAMSRATT